MDSGFAALAISALSFNRLYSPNFRERDLNTRVPASRLLTRSVLWPIATLLSPLLQIGKSFYRFPFSDPSSLQTRSPQPKPNKKSINRFIAFSSRLISSCLDGRHDSHPHSSLANLFTSALTLTYLASRIDQSFDRFSLAATITPLTRSPNSD